MGSALLPIIADLIMQDVETLAINRLPFKLPIYYRYMDDIIFANNALDMILQTFNSLHKRKKTIHN